MKVTQKITTFLWFDDQAEEAVRHYLSIFNNSRIVDVTHCTAAGPRPEGSVLTITFELEGQQFIALNGGPQYKFTEAISLLVSCETQDEVDSYWAKLGAGGEWGPCGWLKDKYGLSWQIAPSALFEMLLDTDRERVNRVMTAMMKMGKIDIAALQAARDAR
jgi:predicted 3-demethylubiquinone-9 3-methyltransferase (glyoxalase superfamily)